MRYWLMKSEPEEFSIQQLQRRGREPWNGVRNYQARNFLRDDMQIGDGVLFYHSNCPIPRSLIGRATTLTPRVRLTHRGGCCERWVSNACCAGRSRWMS